MRRRSDSAIAPPAATQASFDAIAAGFRAELLARGDLDVTAPAGRGTIETNSGFVERRGRPLVDLMLERTGARSLAGLRVADLGCGFGALSAYFAFAGASVAGVDLSADRLELGRRLASRHGLGVELQAARMEALPWADGSFDVAVMNNSLCYLVDPADRRRALEEAARVLAPGGVLVVRNPNRLHPVDRFTDLPLIHLLPPATATRLARRLGRKRSLCRLVSPRTARRELLDARFVAAIHHPTTASPLRPKLVSQYSHLSAVRP